MVLAKVRGAIRDQLAAAAVYERWIERRTFDGVLVLCYHAIRADAARGGEMPFEGLHVTRAVLRAHCEILSRVCQPISLADCREMLRGSRPTPPRPVVVTFDDGYRSVLTEALPILEEFAIPAALFACSDPIARGEMFWYDAVAQARGEQAVEELKTVPYREWRAAFEEARRSALRDAPTAPLTPDEIAQLAAHPLMTIGGHSHRHPILARASADEDREEIVENLDAIEEWTGRRATAFAYPNGRRGCDYTPRTEQALSAAAVDLAFGTDEGFLRRGAAPLSLPRFTVTAGVTGPHLLNRLARVWR